MMPERDEQQHEQLGRLIRFPGTPEPQVPARSDSDDSPQTESTEVVPQQQQAEASAIEATRAISAGDAPVRPQGEWTARSNKPLSPQQAGGRYQYYRSVIADGARRVPRGISDAILNRVKLAHLREGEHHTGEILPQQRTAYEAEMQRRRERRRRALKAIFVRKVHVTRSKSLFGATTREAYRPRWETVGPLAAEAVHLANPHTPVISPLVQGFNNVVADYGSALVANSWGLVSSWASSGSGALALTAGAAGLVAWQASQEHRERQSRLAALMSAEGHGDLAPDEPTDMLTAAFRAAGIIRAGSATSPGQRVELTRPIHSTDEQWTAYIQLPRGVTSDRVRARHAELASALDSDTHRLLVLPGDTSRRLILRCYRDLPMSGPGAEYPLAHAATYDIWRGVPFGTDLFGRPVTIDLVSAHGFAGGATRNGKTFSERVAISAAVLDPYVKISVADFKPAGDWKALRRLAAHFIEGTDRDARSRTRAMLAEASEEIDRRMALLSSSAATRHGAEGQLNRSMARDLELGCMPWIIIIDEVQVATGDPQSGDRTKNSDELAILQLIDDIARRGVAAGVLLLLSTQRPDDNILKSSTWEQLGIRFCLHVQKRSTSDTVLGSGAAEAGADASTLVDRRQRGAGYLHGATSHEEKYVLAQSYNVTASLFAELCERGRQARLQVGTLPEAAGDDGQQGPRLVPIPGMSSDSEPDLGRLDSRQTEFVYHAADVVAEVDNEWVSSAWLYEQVAQRRGEGESADLVKTYGGQALALCGATSERRLIDGRRVMAWRVADIRRIARQLPSRRGVGESEAGAS